MQDWQMKNKKKEYTVVNFYFLPLLKELINAKKEPYPKMVYERVSL